MSPALSIILLLVLNLGLIWLLLAAPVGRRTVRIRRLVQGTPDDLKSAVSPLGDHADWHHAILSSETVGPGRVRQAFAQRDRHGGPIYRLLDVQEAVDARSGAIVVNSRIVEDSALDASFWQDFRERRSLQPVGGGTLLTVEQTDRYKGFAFLFFRHFALRRELKALESWLSTGKSRPGGVFEHPATQAGLAVLSTLLLWPFLGLTAQGLMLSTMLTVVIVLHEFGHMAAYRAFGHERVRMIFVPLLGGVAIGGRPYNSLFEVATCALMGAGMSAFLVPPVIALEGIAESAGFAGSKLSILIFLLILGAFNLLNLLPMNRFDGGQVLRQLFTGRPSQVAGSFAVTLVILWVGWRIGLPPLALVAALAVFTLVSLFGGRNVKPRLALDPMTVPERLLAGLGLYAAIAIHGYAVVYACDRLFA